MCGQPEAGRRSAAVVNSCNSGAALSATLVVHEHAELTSGGQSMPASASFAIA